MKNVRLFPDAKKGKIKPLHGVGGGPLTGHFENDATEEFINAGIPYSRLHDVEWPFGSGEFVDVHCIFPDFDKDENDPASYNFTFTDEYLKAIVAVGTKPFYRLGESIEQWPVKKYIHPPKDFSKWGRICSHIISHYNEGWADGFHMGIEYWEIWNEPELKDQMFTGSEEEILELYDTAARIIKNDHPDVKVGGLATCSPYTPMCEKLLEMASNGTPLDFFSWHGYSDSPELSAAFANKAAELLEKYGLDDVESIYDEWNYVVAWDETIGKSIRLHKTAFCGSYIAAVLSTLQGLRVDKSMIYDGQVKIHNWCSLFSEAPTEVHAKRKKVTIEKPYYAVYNWNKLYVLGEEIGCESDEKIYSAAAMKDDEIAVSVSYFSDSDHFGLRVPADEEIVLSLNGYVFDKAELYITDDRHTNELTPFDGEKFVMSGNSFALVRFKGCRKI